MATNEDNDESDLDNCQFPLLIIHEDDDDHICPEGQSEPLTIYARSWHGDRGGRARGNRRSAGRASLEQRGRGRGLFHKSAERTCIEDSAGNENNVSGRGRGRARDRRPYRGRARGSRHQSADRQDESADKRNVERYDSNRGHVHVKSNISVSKRTNLKHQRTFDNNEQDDTLARGERIHKLSEAKLIALSKSKDEPDALLLEVNKMSIGFINILQKPLDPNSVYFVVRILSIISRSSQIAHLKNILMEVDSYVLTNLTNLLYEISMKDHKFESLWNVPNNIEKFLVNIMAVTKVVMTILTPSLGKCCSLITAIRTVKQSLSLESVEPELEDIETLFKKVKANKELKERRQKTSQKTERRTEPPNSFREIPIFPELNDLHMDERPFLRANKVHGKYDNLDTYLDVQFRLLREDYIQPLRKGISEYRDCIKSGGNVKKIRELKLYHSVQIMYPVCSGRGINHVIQFDTSPFTRIRWASSRRLLHGSLLCMSNDSFDTILYATVTGRDDLQLKDGKLEVHFENTDGLFEKQMSKSFTMAETSAYFEAYRFILEGLQEIESNMPFERYLVLCETTVRPPGYLLSAGGPYYDFTNLLLNQSDSKRFPVLNTREWPKANDLGLDSSQYEALQRAITKELAIIQGPPGTGKTFVGLKIAQLLLDNQTLWKKKENSSQLLLGRRKISRKVERSPILVVCYTNHALDQFLEGLVTMGKDRIVRIGGRCKTESIEKYVLRNVKRQRKDNKEWSYGLSENDAQCKNVLKECEEIIELSNSRMKRSETTILPYKTLIPFMTEAQQDAFESSHTESDLHLCLSKWLRFNQTPQIDTDLSYDQQIQMTWQDFILKEVSPMHDNERQYTGDILNLQPVQRAELYKAWVAELITNIHKLMQHDKSEKEQILDRDELNTVLSQAETTILEVNLLIHYASRHDTRKQILLLSKKYTRGTYNPIWHWLCLSQTTSEIKTILEENSDSPGKSNVTDDNDTVATDDIEEERELDDEDEHLFALKIKAKGTKTSVGKNDGEWLNNWNKKSFSKKVRQMLMQAKPLKQQEAEEWTHVLDLSDQRRKNLYAFWVENYRLSLKEKVKEYADKFNDATYKLQEVRNMETVEILKDSEIVGMTTTGAAKYRKILQIIRPQIIIVEEAAEVLESHIVTTLNESCQHLILIGDHKQLRPSTTVYDLAKKYHMDISLFERMVCNNVPCVTLEEQHRMRPTISMLLTHESLYPKLRNHASVHKYEDIKGIDQNVQFITHEEEETSMAESTSYSNPHEAKYLAKLCRYLLSQGYHRDQISVITPYMGQVLLLRKEMPKSDFEGVRVTAVDNFQGEENDIILLSLVRSRPFEDMPQKRNPIGFVGIENRICVSLSRAKKGFYVIGNFNLLEQYSEMWERMIRMMRQKKLVREGLKLRCQNHPDTVTFAQTVEDFKKVPEGGCNRSCNAELLCGHMCPLNCHPVDRDHQHFLCLMPCEEIICNNNHKCTKRCFEPCGQCNTTIEKLIPMCGHKALMACHVEPFRWKCNKVCESKLPCGHTCNRNCSDCTEEKEHEQTCKILVKRTLECRHTASMKCHDDPTSVDCKVACETLLDCKHKCSGNCGSCFGGKIHQRCHATCEKILPCGHKCAFPCSEFCPPCTHQCEYVCSHGNTCGRKCYEKCKPCYDSCQFKCDRHKIRCTNACNEPCDVQPCSEPCNKELKCKESHGTCKGICGAKCFCIICQHDKLRLDPGGKIEDNMVFIQLPNCFCIFEIGKFRRFFVNELKKGTGNLYKRCPHCSVAITKPIRPFPNVFKTTRENIVQEYEVLVGTFEVRKAKVIKLTREFKQLKQKGFPSEGVDLVIKKLQVDNFGALRYADDVKHRLIILLENCEFMKKSKSSVTIAVEHTEGIVKPSKLRAMLLRGRRFVTKQFWQEVDRELQRMRIWAKFYVLNERLESEGNATLEIADVITAVFQIISRKGFDQEAENISSAVYQSMASTVYQMRSSDLVKIKALLDDFMKDSVEVCNARIEPEAKVKKTGDGAPV